MSFYTAINCMDGRIQESVASFIKKKKNVLFVDMITGAGPIRILSNKKTGNLESIISCIDISLKKHKSKGIAIVAHYDCAGYPVSDEEQKCKDCLNNESCKNPFSEACPCSETCGMAIQKELCEEKEISLVENLTFMLDDYVKRINFSGPENILNLNFGTQHERLTFRITDSYLDKMGFKSLNELIEERDRVIYKSKESCSKTSKSLFN